MVARSVAASVAAGHAISYDEVDDLRIAVGEAASLLLRLPEPATRLTIRIAREPHAILVTLLTDAAVEVWPGGDRDLDGLSWMIITRLVDEAVAETSPLGPVIRLSRRIREPEQSS